MLSSTISGSSGGGLFKDDLVLRNEVVSYDISGDLMVCSYDLVCPLQSKTQTMMSVMKPEPSITVVPVANETEVSDLHDPLSGLLVPVFLHSYKFNQCIIIRQEIKKVSDYSRFLHYLCACIIALVVE